MVKREEGGRETVSSRGGNRRSRAGRILQNCRMIKLTDCAARSGLRFWAGGREGVREEG